MALGRWLRIDVRKQVKTKLSKVTVAILGVVSFFGFGRSYRSWFCFYCFGFSLFFSEEAAHLDGTELKRYSKFKRVHKVSLSPMSPSCKSSSPKRNQCYQFLVYSSRECS